MNIHTLPRLISCMSLEIQMVCREDTSFLLIVCALCRDRLFAYSRFTLVNKEISVLYGIPS